MDAPPEALPRRRGRRLPRGVPFLIVVVAVVASSLLGLLHNSPPFFARLPGVRTKAGDLLIDETDGRFAGTRLGMTLAAAKKALPRKDFVGAQVKGDDLSYCIEQKKIDCRAGVHLGIIGRCEVNACLQADPGPVAEIALYSTGDPRHIAGASKAVTLRGVRLGTPVSNVEHDYKITETGGLVCGAPVPSPGKTYVALAGTNTIEFTSHQGIVWGITLLAGRHPQACH